MERFQSTLISGPCFDSNEPSGPIHYSVNITHGSCEATQESCIRASCRSFHWAFLLTSRRLLVVILPLLWHSTAWAFCDWELGLGMRANMSLDFATCWMNQLAILLPLTRPSFRRPWWPYCNCFMGYSSAMVNQFDPSIMRVLIIIFSCRYFRENCIKSERRQFQFISMVNP